ncbi:hypothetical protein PAPYR_9339 [Paratrimastix pyriformis]|uniref:Uncharacterized protein n=1 Tax=Paratrimastix pyriformis TaxID=342808 RepID=A0ABQ8UFR2_9EUKA|nr:hypothetical protein PAPYR_9339 [Paratrimastix pyriformis]
MLTFRFGSLIPEPLGMRKHQKRRFFSSFFLHSFPISFLDSSPFFHAIFSEHFYIQFIFSKPIFQAAIAATSRFKRSIKTPSVCLTANATLVRSSTGSRLFDTLTRLPRHIRSAGVVLFLPKDGCSCRNLGRHVHASDTGLPSCLRTTTHRMVQLRLSRRRLRTLLRERGGPWRVLTPAFGITSWIYPRIYPDIASWVFPRHNTFWPARGSRVNPDGAFGRAPALIAPNPFRFGASDFQQPASLLSLFLEKEENATDPTPTNTQALLEARPGPR